MSEKVNDDHYCSYHCTYGTCQCCAKQLNGLDTFSLGSNWYLKILLFSSFSQENNAKETNRRMNIFFILIQFSFLQIKGFFLYNKIPINWYFITNNHSISLLCPKHENKSITYKSCKQIHDQHNKINRFCIFAICIYAKSYKFLYQ